MLRSLTVRDLLLLDRLDLEFGAGLTSRLPSINSMRFDVSPRAR